MKYADGDLDIVIVLVLSI